MVDKGREDQGKPPPPARSAHIPNADPPTSAHECHEDGGTKQWRRVNDSGNGRMTVATGLTTVVTGEQQQRGANNSGRGLTTVAGGANIGTSTDRP